MAKTGVIGVRAAWLDVAGELSRATAPADPDPGSPDWDYPAGTWPGAPYRNLPPNCPVKPLGMNGKVTYVIDSQHQLIPVGASEWNDNTFAVLFANQPNYPHHHWPRWSKPDQKTGTSFINGLELRDIKQCLLKAAAERGLFDPSDRLRGRGAWVDRHGQFIWHAGDYLFRSVKGKLTHSEPSEHDGIFYGRRPPILRPWPVPVTAETGPAHAILATLTTWTWERPKLDPLLFLGGLCAMLVGGALKWRPHVFVTGDFGVGKSHLQMLVKMVLGDALHQTADTTAAGIYQRVQQDSLPVAVDELEAGADNAKVMAVVSLARLAASGAMMYRGGSDHTGVEFRATNTFFFSAINPPPLKPEDKSRMAVLNLGRFDPKRVRPDNVIDPDRDGRLLLRLLMDDWSGFRERMTYWDGVLRDAGLAGRARDTYGTLLALAHTVLGDQAAEEAGLPVAEPQQLGTLIADATASERAEQMDNWKRCCGHMFGAVVEGWSGGIKPTIGGTLSEWLSDVIDLRAVRERLALVGLGAIQPKDGPAKGRKLLAVPVGISPQLNRLFAGQAWAGGVWAGALKQAPHDVVLRDLGNGQNVYVGGATTRCLLVDIEKAGIVKEE